MSAPPSICNGTLKAPERGVDTKEVMTESTANDDWPKAVCPNCEEAVPVAGNSVSMWRKVLIVCPVCGTRSEMEPFAKLGWR